MLTTQDKLHLLQSNISRTWKEKRNSKKSGNTVPGQLSGIGKPETSMFDMYGHPYKKSNPKAQSRMSKGC